MRRLILCALLCASAALAQNPGAREFICTSTANSGTAYACNFSVAPASLAFIQNKIVTLIADITNTGAVTFAPNSLTATAVKKVAGGVTTALVAGDLQAGQPVQLLYNGTNFLMISQTGNDPHFVSGQWGSMRTGSAVITPDATEAFCEVAAVGGGIFKWEAGILPSGATGTFNVWILSSSTAWPTISNKVTSTAVGISSNTYVESFTLTDFSSTAVPTGAKVCVQFAAATGSPTWAYFRASWK